VKSAHGAATERKARVRVLLADDHPVVRRGLRLVIDAELDLEVSGEASTAEEAVRLAASTQPDVVLLDITMPGGGGIGALEPLRAVSAGSAVLILTMHEDLEYLRVALASGAKGFLLKNADGGELVAAIRAVHHGRTYVDPTLAGAALRGVLGAPGRGAANGPTALLSPRELEVLGQLALGYTNKEVASRLSVGVKSVETYRARLSEKLGLSGRAELVRYAIENGLVVTEKGSGRQADVGYLV
jgi:two-component system, NarL family, response regulator NreC